MSRIKHEVEVLDGKVYLRSTVPTPMRASGEYMTDLLTQRTEIENAEAVLILGRLTDYNEQALKDEVGRLWLEGSP